MASSLISIIIPVYNTEKYLDRCIQSVLAQTYTNWELLLIDDGSTDSSWAICDKYAEQDSRIKVFHKENGGVSSARNLGLDNAKGEWISFIDSDDWVANQYLEILHQNGLYDFVTGYWSILNCDSFCSKPFYNQEFRKDGIRTFLDINTGKLSYPVCRLYRRSIIKNNRLRFDTKIHFAEDALFNLSYIRYIQTAKQTGDILYYYEKHENSLSNKEIPWAELDRAISQIGAHITALEKQFSWNGNRLRQYYIWGVILRKHLTKLQYKKTIWECVNGLKEIHKNKYVQQIFSNDIDVLKSKSRVLFDTFMKHKLYWWAAIFLKIEYLLLRVGAITRT